MKRSTGMTVLAILVLVGGAFMAGGALTSLAAGPGVLALQREQLAAAFDDLPAGTGEGQIPREQLERAKAQLDQVMGELEAALRSQTARTLAGFGGLLGAAAFAAGIGILMMRGWGRILLVWQAALSVPYALWSSQWSFGLQQRASEALFALVQDAAMRSQLQQALQAGQAAGIGLAVGFAVLWNGFILWYFSRASVRAQFARPGT